MASARFQGRYLSLSGKIVAGLYLVSVLFRIGDAFSELTSDAPSISGSPYVGLRLQLTGLLLVGVIAYLSKRDWGWIVLVAYASLALGASVLVAIQGHIGSTWVAEVAIETALLLGLILPPILRRRRHQALELAPS